MDRRTFIGGTVAAITAATALPLAAHVTSSTGSTTMARGAGTLLVGLTAEDGMRQLTGGFPSPLLEIVLANPERYASKGEWFVQALRDHYCTCENCDPTLWAAPARRPTGHYALRFWEDRYERYPSDEDLYNRYAKPYVDGRLIVSTTEIITGDPGSIRMFRGVAQDDPEILNSGARHSCVPCQVKAIEAGFSMKNREYRRQMSKIDQQEQIMLVTPRYGACQTWLTLPNVTVEISPDAREHWQASVERDDRYNRIMRKYGGVEVDTAGAQQFDPISDDLKNPRIDHGD